MQFICEKNYVNKWLFGKRPEGKPTKKLTKFFLKALQKTHPQLEKYCVGKRHTV